MEYKEYFEDGMPKIDDDGREIVRIVTDETPNGWRYGYKDTLILGYKDYDAGKKVPVKPAASPPEIAVTEKPADDGQGQQASPSNPWPTPGVASDVPE